MAIQQTINNLLATTAITAGGIKAAAKEKKPTAAPEADAEAAEISATQQKLEEATQMAIGYTGQQARAKSAEKALGDVIGETYNKKPRGVGQKTYERRMANAETMKVIYQKAAQDKDFRERINKFSAKELSLALKPTIDKKEAKKNGKK